MKSPTAPTIFLLLIAGLCWIVPQGICSIQATSKAMEQNLQDSENCPVRTDSVESEKSETVESNNGRVASSVLATITAYCLTGIMASGKEVYDGAIACPRNIPLGTKIIIGNMGYTCEDRLAMRYDDRFDIWMSDCNDCMEWGVQKLKVKVYFLQ